MTTSKSCYELFGKGVQSYYSCAYILAHIKCKLLIASSQGLSMLFNVTRVTLKNMGRPGDEAKLLT